MTESGLQKELRLEWQELLAELAERELEPPAWLAEGRPVLPVRPEALFAQLEEVLYAWRELREHPLEGLAQRYVNAAWTLKDLLGHLASWAAEFRREAEAVAKGDGFDYVIPFALSAMGPTEWNQTEAERQRPKALAAILEQFESEIRRLEDLVAGLPEEVLYRPARFPLSPSGDPEALWTGNVAQMILGKCVHDQHHLRGLRAWLDRQEQAHFARGES